MAKSVWALRDDDSSLPIYEDETPDQKLWLLGLSETLSNNKFLEALVTLWSIWYARRHAIHEQEYQSPCQPTCSLAGTLMRLPTLISNGDHSKLLLLLYHAGSPATRIHEVEHGWCAAKSENKAVGVVCRDEHCIFHGASAMVQFWPV